MIAGKHPEIRKRWIRGLQERSTVHVVDGQADLQGSLATIRPAVLLFGLAVRGAGGVRGLPALHQASPKTKVMAFSNLPTTKEALAAVKAGATGYCGKDISIPLLRKAVDSIRDGEIWIARDLVSSLIEELAVLLAPRRQAARSRANGAFDRLSSREREVVSLVGDGASNQEIASRLDLNLTEGAVKTLLGTVFSKLGVPNRIRLALLVNNHATNIEERKVGGMR
jgi:DNA-binding NarL/FixJ family response regulator